MACGRITIDIVDLVPHVHGLPEEMMFHKGQRPWLIYLVRQAGLIEDD